MYISHKYTIAAPTCPTGNGSQAFVSPVYTNTGNQGNIPLVADKPICYTAS